MGQDDLSNLNVLIEQRLKDVKNLDAAQVQDLVKGAMNEFLNNKAHLKVEKTTRETSANRSRFPTLGKTQLNAP